MRTNDDISPWNNIELQDQEERQEKHKNVKNIFRVKKSMPDCLSITNGLKNRSVSIKNVSVGFQYQETSPMLIRSQSKKERVLETISFSPSKKILDSQLFANSQVKQQKHMISIQKLKILDRQNQSPKKSIKLNIMQRSTSFLKNKIQVILKSHEQCIKSTPKFQLRSTSSTCSHQYQQSSTKLQNIRFIYCLKESLSKSPQRVLNKGDSPHLLDKLLSKWE